MPLALALALAWALIFSAGQSNAASVAFDLSGLSAQDYRRIDGLGLERKLALRLVQEGFAVVAPSSGADVEVRASMTPDGLELRAVSGASSRSIKISAEEAPNPEWHLEVAHKISELARALAPTKPRDGPASAEPPGPEPRRALEQAPEASSVRSPGWEVGLAAGAIFRSGGSGPLVGLSATNSLGRLRLHLDVLGTWSRGTEIEVWEAQGSAGIGAAVIDGALGLDVGLAGGVVIQRFDLSNPWAEDRGGASASPAVWAPAYVRWAGKHLVFSGRAALGLARTPQHTGEGATLWSRGAVRLETVLVVAWAF